MQAADIGPGAGDLAEMSDPDLIRHWAEVRTMLALTRTDSPRYAEVKPAYDAVLAEYRRRLGAKAAP